MLHILCFGNALHGDDGFGPAVYQGLSALPQPNGLRLFDAGTPGLAALTLFQGCDEAIIVDALAPANSPGKLFELSADAILSESALPGHGVGVGFLLQALAALPERQPSIRIIAAEAATLTPFQPGLSEDVALAVEKAIALLSVYFIQNNHE